MVCLVLLLSTRRMVFPYASVKGSSLCVIFMILVSFENVKKCVLGGCMITSNTKINIFWKNLVPIMKLFLHSGYPSGTFCTKNVKKRWFETDSALSCKNETKIVKITHSGKEGDLGNKKLMTALHNLENVNES